MRLNNIILRGVKQKQVEMWGIVDCAFETMGSYMESLTRRGVPWHCNDTGLHLPAGLCLYIPSLHLATVATVYVLYRLASELMNKLVEA